MLMSELLVFAGPTGDSTRNGRRLAHPRLAAPPGESHLQAACGRAVNPEAHHDVAASEDPYLASLYRGPVARRRLPSIWHSALRSDRPKDLRRISAARCVSARLSPSTRERLRPRTNVPLSESVATRPGDRNSFPRSCVGMPSWPLCGPGDAERRTRTFPRRAWERGSRWCEDEAFLPEPGSVATVSIVTEFSFTDFGVDWLVAARRCEHPFPCPPAPVLAEHPTCAFSFSRGPIENGGTRFDFLLLGRQETCGHLAEAYRAVSISRGKPTPIR